MAIVNHDSFTLLEQRVCCHVLNQGLVCHNDNLRIFAHVVFVTDLVSGSDNVRFLKTLGDLHDSHLAW